MDLNNLEARIAAAHGANLVMALDPNEMYELVALLKRQEAEHLATHRKLAAETLRADQGWQRYEEANADRNALRAARAILAAQPAAAAPDAQPDAWMTEDERVVHASTMAGAKKDGGALLSSMRPFNIALYRHAAAQPEAKDAPAQASLQANAGPSHGDMPVDRFIKAMPLPQYPIAAAPAMGEELPPQDERAAFEEWYAKRHPKPIHENPTWAHASKIDDWEVWKARACMALRQPGAAINLSKLLEEVADVLSGNNWRGDLVEALREATTAPVSQPAAQESVAWADESESSLYWAKGHPIRTNAGKVALTYVAPQPLSAPAGSEQEAAPAPATLSDEQIKEVAINYAAHVAADIYDVTKYDCAEDFFNCVRACVAAAGNSQGLDGGSHG